MSPQNFCSDLYPIKPVVQDSGLGVASYQVEMNIGTGYEARFRGLLVEAILLVAQLTHDLNMNVISCRAIYLVVSAISTKFFGKASKEKKKQWHQPAALLLAS